MKNDESVKTIFDFVIVLKVMLAEALDIVRETYLAILMDRAFDGPVIVASPAGGVDIEEVAETMPDRIYKVRTVVESLYTRKH